MRYYKYFIKKELKEKILLYIVGENKLLTNKPS